MNILSVKTVKFTHSSAPTHSVHSASAGPKDLLMAKQVLLERLMDGKAVTYKF